MFLMICSKELNKENGTNDYIIDDSYKLLVLK